MNNKPTVDDMIKYYEWQLSINTDNMTLIQNSMIKLFIKSLRSLSEGKVEAIMKDCDEEMVLWPISERTLQEILEKHLSPKLDVVKEIKPEEDWFLCCACWISLPEEWTYCKKCDNIPQPTHTVDENTSDWYHTFKELYEHRISLFISLIKCNPTISWRANNNDDWWHRDWYFVAWMHLPNGDISYHLPEDKWTTLDWLWIATTLNAPKRDWYTASDVVKRLNDRLPAQPTQKETVEIDRDCPDCWCDWHCGRLVT